MVVVNGCGDGGGDDEQPMLKRLRVPSRGGVSGEARDDKFIRILAAVAR